MTRVLVVDDDEDLLEVIVSILEPLGLEPLTTTRGARALKLLEVGGFALVVSDLVMPGVDGHDLIETMRARGDQTPVLFLSGTGGVPDAVRLMRSGAIGFLQKPFDPRELKREVLAAIQSAKSAPEPTAVGARQAVVGVDATRYAPEGYEAPALPGAPPRELGRYALRGLIAAGGMGQVYRAYDPSLDRDVALKVILAPDDIDWVQFTTRFRREAVALAKLRHPAVVAVHDFGLDERSGTPYLVMELVEGRSLSWLLDNAGRLPVQRALSIALQLAQGLAYVHRHGIVHRDIKPDNVLLEHGDRVRLIDFGVARIEDSELTRDRAVVGSPSYLSPEAAAGERVDWRADQFSLATLLLKMLSNERIFTCEMVVATMYRIRTTAAPTLAELGVEGAPDALQAVLTRMHEKAPAARYQNENELLDALQALAAGG